MIKYKLLRLFLAFLLSSNIFARFLAVGNNPSRPVRSLRLGEAVQESECISGEKKAVNRCWKIKNRFKVCRTVFVATCQLKKKGNVSWI